MQSVLRLLYPARCVSCGDEVADDFGLCGACWAKTPLIAGAVCDICGVPLPGEAEATERLACDDCLTTARPWSRGRAALTYGDNGRRMVLALKYGDRTDLVRPAARWMLRAFAPLLQTDLLLVPVPAHWTRLFTRRYNQAALLAQALARESGLKYLPDALIRPRPTPTQDHKTRARRFADLQGAIRPHPKRGKALAGKGVVLIDDVMASGATLTASAEACRQAGSRDVFTLVLARATKDA